MGRGLSTCTGGEGSGDPPTWGGGTRGSLIDFPVTREARGLDINGKKLLKCQGFCFVAWIP